MFNFEKQSWNEEWGSKHNENEVAEEVVNPQHK